MKKLLVIAAAAALAALAACGGSKGTDGAAAGQTPQGIAKQWLEAAVASNDLKVRELSADDFKERSGGLAAQVREKYTSMEGVKWGGSGKEGSEYSWSATGPGGVVFFKVKQFGDQFRVTEVTPSW